MIISENAQGSFYASSFDATQDKSMLYSIDSETGETTLVGSFEQHQQITAMFVHPVTEAIFAFVSDLRGAHAQAGEVQKRGGVYANPPPYLVTFDLGSAAIGKWTKVCGPLLVRDEPSSDDAASSLLDESTQPHIIGDAAVAADGTILAYDSSTAFIGQVDPVTCEFYPLGPPDGDNDQLDNAFAARRDRKSTRLNSSHR